MQRSDVLSEKVQQFAGDIIGVALLFDDNFTFVTDEAKGYRQSTQRIQGTVGIQLDHMRLYLELDYSLFLSHLEQFLTVGQSSFILRLHSKRSEPMIRWGRRRQGHYAAHRTLATARKNDGSRMSRVSHSPRPAPLSSRAGVKTTWIAGPAHSSNALRYAWRKSP